jgi:5-methylcytosine-specific restriction endonuclease McrA
MHIRPIAEVMRDSSGRSYYQIEREKKLDKVFVCKECGREYTPRKYVLDAGLKTYSNPGYCSAECKRRCTSRSIHRSHKEHKIGENHRARARKYGCAYDSSVTLPKLIKRDGLRCAICGEMCDPNDRSWNKYMGAMSPTIDHIIPMAKGGGHTWDNVQVAHAICNSYKCDNLSEV